MEKWPSLSQTILRISESILGLDFNQMSDDAELLLETPICCLLPIPLPPVLISLSIWRAPPELSL